MEEQDVGLQIIEDSYDMATSASTDGYSESFILEYPQFFDDEYCQIIIDKFNILDKEGFSDISGAGYGGDKPSPDSQFFRSKGKHLWFNHVARGLDFNHVVHTTNEVSFFFEQLKTAVRIYKTKFRVGLSVPLTCNDMKVQRVKAGGGFHAWHSEWSKESNSRMLVYQLYLNTLPEGEGETEFLNLGVRCKPEVGKLVIWPAGWTHVHRGNPNYTTDKYIITGWFHVNDLTLNYNIE